jgi:hypothetical protein
MFFTFCCKRRTLHGPVLSVGWSYLSASSHRGCHLGAKPPLGLLQEPESSPGLVVPRDPSPWASTTGFASVGLFPQAYVTFWAKNMKLAYHGFSSSLASSLLSIIPLLTSHGFTSQDCLLGGFIPKDLALAWLGHPWVSLFLGLVTWG